MIPEQKVLYEDSLFGVRSTMLLIEQNDRKCPEYA